MTNSDIIAIIAIAATVIVAITGGIFSYLANRANNRAKLQEMAFDRQLNAFSRITELIGELENERRLLHHSYERMKIDNEDDNLTPEQGSYLLNKMQLIQDNLLQLRTVYTQNVIYLTDDISKEINKYIRVLFWEYPIVVSSIDAYDKNICAGSRKTDIVSKMRAFIGIKQDKSMNTSKNVGEMKLLENTMYSEDIMYRKESRRDRKLRKSG